jgi:hypothetical protein
MGTKPAAGRRRVHVEPGVRYSVAFMCDVDALRRGVITYSAVTD